jgi:hypothetical protein
MLILLVEVPFNTGIVTRGGLNRNSIEPGQVQIPVENYLPDPLPIIARLCSVISGMGIAAKSHAAQP